MKPLGVAIVGASARSSMMFEYLAEHPQEGFVRGVFDIVPACAHEQIRHHRAEQARVYESLQQAVDDPLVDIVFIASTDSAHAEAAVAGLKAGKHVFSEKPMATSLEDCDRILEAGRSAPGIYYLGMNLRHGPLHRTMHRLLSEGLLGKCLTIEANEHYQGGQTYFRRWNRLEAHGGGLWVTKACHDFDLLNWFAGGRARRVYATTNLSHFRPRGDAARRCRDCDLRSSCPEAYDIEQPPLPPHRDRLRQLVEQADGVPRDLCLWNSDKDTFDNGLAVVEYDNDVRATYTVNVVSSHSTRQLRLSGTQGFAEGDVSTGLITLRQRNRDDVVTYDMRDQMNAGHGGADPVMLRDFFRCCRMGEPPQTSYSQGRSSIALALAARQSSRLHEVVTLADKE